MLLIQTRRVLYRYSEALWSAYYYLVTEQATNLGGTARVVDNVEALARHGGIESALDILQVLIPLNTLGINNAVLDAVRHVLVGRPAATSLSKLTGMRLSLLLLGNLGLSKRDGGVGS